MGKGQAIAGMVLGIVSLVICWFGVLSFVALPLAIVALILAILSGKKFKANGQKSGIATAALVISIIATALSGVAFVSCGLCTICVADSINDAANAINSSDLIK